MRAVGHACEREASVPRAVSPLPDVRQCQPRTGDRLAIFTDENPVDPPHLLHDIAVSAQTTRRELPAQHLGAALDGDASFAGKRDEVIDRCFV